VGSAETADCRPPIRNHRWADPRLRDMRPPSLHASPRRHAMWAAYNPRGFLKAWPSRRRVVFPACSRPAICTLGNYLGAIVKFVPRCRKITTCIYCVVRSARPFTVWQDPGRIAERQTREGHCRLPRLRHRSEAAHRVSTQEPGCRGMPELAWVFNCVRAAGLAQPHDPNSRREGPGQGSREKTPPSASYGLSGRLMAGGPPGLSRHACPGSARIRSSNLELSRAIISRKKKFNQNDISRPSLPRPTVTAMPFFPAGPETVDPGAGERA